MSIRHVAAAFDVRGITATERLVLLSLCDCADRHGKVCVLTRTLAGRTSLSEHSVRDAIDALDIKGLISVNMDYSRDVHVGYLYTVNLSGVSTVDRS